MNEFKGRISIRQACIEDNPSIANVMIQSWKDGFKEIIPQSYLDNLDTGKVSGTLKKAMMYHSFVVAEIDGEIMGFAGFGRRRIESFNEYESELHAIHVLPCSKGIGIGSQLFNAAVQKLKKNGSRNMLLSVFEDNKANQFYKKHGGILISQRQVTYDKNILIENIYGFQL